MRYCIKRKRSLVPSEMQLPRQLERFLEYRGHPNGLRFIRVKFQGMPDIGTGDGTVDFHWYRLPVLAKLQNFNQLETEYFSKSTTVRRNKNIEVRGETRCKFCNQLHFVDAATLQDHQERDCLHIPKIAVGSKDDKTIRRRKMKTKLTAQNTAVQLPEPENPVGQHTLEIVTEYKLLGKIVSYDGDCKPDILNRQAQADISFFQLTNIWPCTQTFLMQKLVLYQHVQQIVKYGAMSWRLTKANRKLLNGWNARRLAKIVPEPTENYYIEGGSVCCKPKTPQQLLENKTPMQMQAEDPATDLVQGIEYTQFVWLGAKLRLEKTRIVRQEIMCYTYRVLRGP